MCDFYHRQGVPNRFYTVLMAPYLRKQNTRNKRFFKHFRMEATFKKFLSKFSYPHFWSAFPI